MKPTVLNRRKPADLHTLTLTHPGPPAARQAALGARRADISRARSGSLPTRVKDVVARAGVRPDESGVIPGRTRRDSLELTGHQASIFLVVVSAPPVLMATFTASS